MIRQVVTIGELFKMNEKQRLLHYDTQFHYTSQSLIDKGIWACHLCGQLQDSCRSSCVNCHQEKFVLRKPGLLDHSDKLYNPGEKVFVHNSDHELLGIGIISSALGEDFYDVTYYPKYARRPSTVSRVYKTLLQPLKFKKNASFSARRRNNLLKHSHLSTQLINS